MMSSLGDFSKSLSTESKEKNDTDSKKSDVKSENNIQENDNNKTTETASSEDESDDEPKNKRKKVVKANNNKAKGKTTGAKRGRKPAAASATTAAATKKSTRGRKPRKESSDDEDDDEEEEESDHKQEEEEEEEEGSTSEDEPLAKKAKTSQPPTDDENDEIKSNVKKTLEGANLEQITIKTVCQQVNAHYPDVDVAHKKDFIKITGTVTSVNKQLLTFELNNITTIHMGFRLFKDTTQQLPKLFDTIKLETNNFQSNESHIIKTVVLDVNDKIENMLPTTTTTFNLTTENNNSFFKLIKMFKLNVSDLFKIDNFYRLLLNNFKFDNTIKEELLISLITTIITNDKKTMLEKIKLKLISQYNLVNNIINNYPKHFPYWTYEHHMKETKNDCLIGFLYFDKFFKTISFRNDRYRMRCALINSGNCAKFLDCYILIKKYVIVAEIFNEDKVRTIEYLLINPNNVLLLYNKVVKPLECPTTSFLNSFNLIIVIKGNITLSFNNNLPECWLDVRLVRNNQIYESAYLCLTTEYNIKNFAYLQEDGLYKVQHNGRLIRNNTNRELNLMHSNYNQYILQTDAVFELLESQTTQYNYKNNFITFKAIVQNKKFMNPLESRTNVKIVVPNFGTQGKQTHLLELLRVETKYETDLYLNNWEHLLQPIGLIPNMEILVKNVVLQSRPRRSYYKSTLFTTFKLLNYPCEFESVRFNENDCGLPFCLSDGFKVPIHVFVRCEIIALKITSLMVNRQGDKIQMRFKLNATDSRGESVVSVTRDGVARYLFCCLFDFQIEEFNQLCAGLQGICPIHYEYKRNESYLPVDLKMSSRDLFKNTFLNMLMALNRKVLKIDFLCQRLHSTKNQHFGKPIWNLINLENIRF